MDDFLDILDRVIQNVTNFGLEYVFNRYYSIYRGVVTENRDPDKQGRILARVPEITGNDNLTDWAWPRFMGAGYQSGMFHSPEIGDPVYIEFLSGDINAPVYSGGWWGKVEGELDTPTDLQKDPPTAKGWYTSTGHGILFETEAGNEQVKLQWHDPTADTYSFIVIDKDGSIQMANHQGTMMVLNAANGKEGITIIDKHGNLLASNDKGWQLVQKDGVLIELKQNVATIMGKEVVISGEGLNVATGGCTLGQGATEPLVLGNKLMALWSQAMAAFSAHIHNANAPFSPTSPPVGMPFPSYTPDTNSLKNKSA